MFFLERIVTEHEQDEDHVRVTLPLCPLLFAARGHFAFCSGFHFRTRSPGIKG